MSPADWWTRRRSFLENRGWMPSLRSVPAGKPSDASAAPSAPKLPNRPPAESRPERPLTTREIFVRNTLMSAAVLVLAFVVNTVVLSSVQQHANQQKLRNEFQSQLALATAPTSEGDVDSVLLPNGAPVALIRIPELGVNQVVVEGTDAGTLKLGPGHRRDTVLPGQEGTSVIMARAWAYNGPFNDLQSLSPGSKIEVITGQGFHNYEVIGVRYAGDPVPARPGSGESRLVLTSARGSAFAPSGVVRVDAQMISTSPVDPAAGTAPLSPGPGTPSKEPQLETNAPSSSESSSPEAASTTAELGTPSPLPSEDATDVPSETPAEGPTGQAAESSIGSRAQTTAFAAGARFTFPQTLPISQREMATDTSGLLLLVFALQFLVVVELLTMWSYRRFGFERTWIVAAPVVFLAVVVVADQATLLLPNLL